MLTIANQRQVTKIHQCLENKSIKTNRLLDFNQEFDKILNNGSLVELSPEGMNMWDGPVHYISL